jgi:hypothetical protein
MRSFWKNSLLLLAFASLPVLVFMTYPLRAKVDTQMGAGADKVEMLFKNRPKIPKPNSISPDMELTLDI